ncbi:MAG: diacylglycerol/lipid kinase family protein, partial [Vicinamibacterales bacterium]
PVAAIARALDGDRRAIDAGILDGRPFFNIAGVGVDAVIAARFGERGIRKRGPLAYVQLSTIELLRYRAQTYSLTIDGEPFEHRALLLAIANGRQYGNRMLIAPGARLDDGLLEVVIVEDLSLLGIAWRLPALLRGTLKPHRGVAMRAAKEMQIRAEGAIPFHVDGEPRLGQGVLTIRTHPGALVVRAKKP